MDNKIDFKMRPTQKELLDKESIHAHELRKNLNEFIMLNQTLGSKSCLIQALNKIYSSYKSYFTNKKLTLVDLGCGAGDLLIEIHHWANQRNIAAHLIGVDSNPDIVEFAKQKTASFDNISIMNVDIFSFIEQLKEVDVVCFNNVLHHFTDEQIIQLIHLLSSKVNLGIIINDLRRSPLAYYGIKWISKLMNMSKLAQNDGPLSVLKSFKKEDFEKYLIPSNIKHFEMNKRWAFRWQVMIYLKNG